MKNRRDRITTLAGIVAGLLFACGGASAQQVSTAAQITLTNSGAPQGMRTLTFGVGPGATPGIDVELGEDAFPPFPPSAVFEARFVSHGGSDLGEGSPADIRPSVSAGQKDEYKIRLQPGTNGLPVTITWDMEYLKSHYTSVKMKDPFGGVIMNVDMLATSTTQVTNAALTEVLIEAEGPKDPSMSADDGSSTSLRFDLRSAPNPVGNGLTIDYTLAGPTTVTLTVADLRGETVARVVENGRREAGRHQERLETGGLAPGIYFITLEADGSRTTVRVVR